MASETIACMHDLSNGKLWSGEQQSVFNKFAYTLAMASVSRASTVYMIRASGHVNSGYEGSGGIYSVLIGILHLEVTPS